MSQKGRAVGGKSIWAHLNRGDDLHSFLSLSKADTMNYCKLHLEKNPEDWLQYCYLFITLKVLLKELEINL